MFQTRDRALEPLSGDDAIKQARSIIADALDEVGDGFIERLRDDYRAWIRRIIKNQKTREHVAEGPIDADGLILSWVGELVADVSHALGRGALVEGSGWLDDHAPDLADKIADGINTRPALGFASDRVHVARDIASASRGEALWLCHVAWTQSPVDWRVHSSVADEWSKVRDGGDLPSAMMGANVVAHVARFQLSALNSATVRDHLCREVMGANPDGDAINALSIAINARAGELLELIDADEISDALGCRDALIATLKGIGDTGKASADNVSASWRAWFGRIDDQGAPKAPAFAVALAEALWLDVIKPRQVERRRKRAGIVRATYSGHLLPMMERQQGFAEMDDGIIRDGKRRVAAIELAEGASLERVRNGVHLLGSVHGHRLVRTLVHQAHDQWLDGHHDPRRLTFGSFREVADAIRYTKGNTAPIKDLVMAGACVIWDTGIARGGGLWGWTERRGTRGSPGEVSITLLDPLTPGIASELASGDRTKSLRSREGRRLVPELRFDVPVGRTRQNEHGAIYTMGRRLMVEMVDRAEELARRGAIIITPDEMREMARKAGVPRGIVDRVLGAWVEGDSDAAPALVERDGDAWTLADAHAPERDFIIEGGKRRGRGRARGKRSGRKRATGKRAASKQV